MYYRLKRWLIVGCIFMPLFLSPFVVRAETELEMDTWTYYKEWDKLNNLSFSIVRSPMPKRNLYDNIRLKILCKDNKLQLVTETSSLITSQDREFDFEYQIDKKAPVDIKFRTFKDNKRRGYSNENIDQIAGQLLSGETIFIRINTIISTVLTAAMPLKEASAPIQQVLADCGIVKDKTPAQQVYSLVEFERDFVKLSPEQQGRALIEIKKVMEQIR
jgi:hypothetical protein